MSSGIRLDGKTTIRNVAGWTLLIRVDPVDKKQGMIELPGDVVVRRELAQTRGTVLDIANSAWDDEIQKGGSARCVLGDRVLFRQYAGEMLDVEGSEKYRIINDKDVYAVLEPISDQQPA